MPVTNWMSKGSALFLISAFEIGTPFLRMMVLTRLLDLRELGFASALAATYGAFEQMTDVAMHRFAFSSRAEEYADALAGAHALSVVRGLFVGALAVALAPLLASAFSLRAESGAFACLGAIILLRSFENLAPRVAERDYQYGVQLKVSLVSNGLGLAAMVVTAFEMHDHSALLLSLFGQTIGQVAASQLLADNPYRWAFRSPQFVKAFHFAYPLWLNGIGLAVSSQGDRFLVGSLLGLPALAVYSVVMLATVVPTTMVFRLLTTVNLAAFYNASGDVAAMAGKLRFAARFSPLVAMVYALGIVILLNVVVPAVFGAQFVVGRFALVLLALGALFRIIRLEPMTSLLLNERRTRRLALANLSLLSGLGLAWLLITIWPAFESALLGRGLGEAIGLVFSAYIVRDLLGESMWDFCVSTLFGLLIVGSAGLATYFAPPAMHTALIPVLFCIYFPIIVVWGIRIAPLSVTRAVTLRVRAALR